MGLFSSIFKVIRKVSNFLGLGIPDKIDSWLFPDIEQERKALQVAREGSNNALGIVYGTQKVGGVVVHKYVTDGDGGVKNEYLHLIVAFCAGLVDDIEEVYFNDVSEFDSRYNKDGGGKWHRIKKYQGFSSETADPDAVAEIPNWTNKCTLNDVCYAYIRLEIDEDQEVWRGEPRITARIRGRRVLNTLTSTAEYSENPAFCLRDYLLDQRSGAGLTLDRIDEAAFQAVAAACNDGVEVTETITGRSEYIEELDTYRPLPDITVTKTIKRFTCNILLDSGNKIIDNVRELLGTFRGIMPPEYIMSPIIEDVGSPVATYGVEDIVSDISVDYGDINKRYNQVEVKFPNKSADYETDSAFYPPRDSVVHQDWLDEDGGRELTRSFTFNGISNKGEAEQMAEIIAKRSRLQTRCSIDLPPYAIEHDVGDIIGLTIDTHGWINKPFRINEKGLTDDGGVSFALTEHEDAIYPWSGRAYDDVVGGTFLGDPTKVAAPELLTFEPDGTLVTAGLFSWQAVDSAFVDSYRVRVSRIIRDNEGEIINRTIVLDDVTKGTSYEIPVFVAAEYELSVRSVSTLATLSPSAALLVIFAEPVTPVNIITDVRTWEIFAAAELSGGFAGTGTTFNYDIVLGDGTGYTPSPLIERQATATFTGLLPQTTYTIYAQATNSFGDSEWYSETHETLIDDAQVKPFLDPLQEEINDANDKIDNLEFGEEPFTFQDVIDQYAGGVTGNFANWERIEDIKDETRVRKQQFEQLSGELDTANGNITATITRVDQVEIDVSGNTSAISVLDQRVDNNDNDISGITTSLQAVQLDVNNNVTAINALDARVESNEDFASAQLVLNATYESDLNTLEARAWLGVDVNDRVTGINIQGSVSNGIIDFIGDKVRFLRPDNLAVAFQWSSADDEFIFDGKIIATDSTFTGTVTASTIQGSTVSGGLVTGADIVGGTIDINNGTFVVNSGGYAFLKTAVGGAMRTGGTGGVEFLDSLNTVRARVSLDGDVFCRQVSATGDVNGDHFAMKKLSVNPSGSFSTVGNYIGWIQSNGAGLYSDAQSGFDFLAAGGGYGPFTGGHQGLCDKDMEFEQGDILTDGELINIGDVSNAIFECQASNEPNEPAIGVYVGSNEEFEQREVPALKGCDIDLSKYQLVRFNAVGEGVVNVCGEGGNIKRGDLIVTSSMPGKGMKQKDDIIRSYTFAKARHAINFDSADEVKQLACIYLAG